MLKDFKERVDEVRADSCFLSFATLEVFDEAFEFGEDYRGVVAHMSVELEKAARLLHSHNEDERRSGFHRAKMVGEALELLSQGIGPRNIDEAIKI